MSNYDFFVIFIFIVATILVSLFFSSFEEKELRKHFRFGLWIKVFGGLSFGLVYTFYYTYGGDTKSYYDGASSLCKILFSSPESYIKLLFNNDLGNLTVYDFRKLFYYDVESSEFFVIKLTSIFILLGLNSYFGTTILFAIFSFIGNWLFFKAFFKEYKSLKNQLAIPFLYIPSVFFWGSGISKDSLVLGFMGLSFFYYMKLSERFNIFHLIIVIVSSYIILSIKAYVIISIVPVILIYYVIKKRKEIENKLIKASLLPVIIILSLSIGYFAINSLGKINPKYSIDNVIYTSQQMQSWHYVEGENRSDLNGRGSSYTLGDYEPTLLGILSIAPSAINVALFRPYIWEVKNAGMLAAAIESFFVFLFSIWILAKVGLKQFFILIFENELAFMCIIFSFIFLFFVGFSSYNFGALMRYKIPAIPFYISGLLIIFFHHKNNLKVKPWD